MADATEPIKASDALPEGWLRHQTEDGREYFENAALSITQWERPIPSQAGAGRWELKVLEDGRVYYENEALSTTQWEMPEAFRYQDLPPGWMRLVTEDGRQYYENAELSVTQWDMPVAAAGTTTAAATADAASGSEGVVAADTEAAGPQAYTAEAASDAASVGAAGAPSSDAEGDHVPGATDPGPDPGAAAAAAPVRAAADVTEAAAAAVPPQAAESKPEAAAKDASAPAPAAPSTEAPAPTPAAPVPLSAAGSPGGAWTPRPAARYAPRPDIEDDAGEWESREELEESLLYFHDIDRNRRGFVTADDLREYSELNELGLTEDDITAAVEAQDADGDGRITVREFLMALGRPPPADKAWFFDALFDRFVADRRAGASPLEVRKMLECVEAEFQDDDLRHWMQHPLGSRGSDGMRRIPIEAFRQIFLPSRFVP